MYFNRHFRKKNQLKQDITRMFDDKDKSEIVFAQYLCNDCSWNAVDNLT
jgi:hypothetical protein